jgi:hypothetical protein
VWRSALCAWVALVLVTATGCAEPAKTDAANPEAVSADEQLLGSMLGDRGAFLGQALRTMLQGRETFRFDTFGDEDFWGGQLRLHEGIETSARSEPRAHCRCFVNSCQIDRKPAWWACRRADLTRLDL